MLVFRYMQLYTYTSMYVVCIWSIGLQGQSLVSGPTGRFSDLRFTALSEPSVAHGVLVQFWLPALSCAPQALSQVSEVSDTVRIACSQAPSSPAPSTSTARQAAGKKGAFRS